MCQFLLNDATVDGLQYPNFSESKYRQTKIYFSLTQKYKLSSLNVAYL